MRTTSLTIEWHSCGLCCWDDMVFERTTVSRNSKTIRIHQMNGRRETLLDESVKANAADVEALFEQIDYILSTDTWSSDYSVEVCDGFMWDMILRQGISSRIKIHGTVAPPPHGEELERAIRKMLRDLDATFEPELFCATKYEDEIEDY